MLSFLIIIILIIVILIVIISCAIYVSLFVVRVGFGLVTIYLDIFGERKI